MLLEVSLNDYAKTDELEDVQNTLHDHNERLHE
jgi:hypothetical protein